MPDSSARPPCSVTASPRIHEVCANRTPFAAGQKLSNRVALSSLWQPSPGLDFLAVSTTRTSTLGPAGRPIAVPVDLATANIAKASGTIELPLHIRWSGEPIAYDLDDRADRARVYEQVLREGTEGDVLFYVRADQLVEQWHELVLPPEVRRAWASWVAAQRRPE